MTDPVPCQDCDEPADRTFGTGDYCDACAETRIDAIRQRVTARHGQLPGPIRR